METWQSLLADSITLPAQCAARFRLDPDATARAAGLLPVRINPYFAGLIRNPQDPIGLQVLPRGEEAEDGSCPLDPLGEERHSPVPAVIHRYPDRALLLASSACPVHCRFCTRKRKVAAGFAADGRALAEGVAYLKDRGEIRDVLVSGGDPLLLPDERLGELLSSLRSIPHLKVVRIGSRVPGALPQRVTPALARLLGRFHPLYLNLHFNHPRELTAEAAAACGRLADAGLPLGSQTVLLAGVNDDAATLEALFTGLLAMRVRPYYLFQVDTVRGSSHFRVGLDRALGLGEELRRRASGMAVPTLAVDLPEAGGKVPLTADRVVRREGVTFLRSLEGREIPYPDRD